MADMDKVIKALHCCAHTDGSDCMYCPYDNSDEECTALMSMDVLELLKEQETVVPLTIDDAVSEIMDKHYKRLEEQIKNRDESLEKAREEIEWLRGMLKEQEAVKPILSVKDRCYYCGNCDETEVKTYDHYCPRCGRAVKWE